MSDLFNFAPKTDSYAVMGNPITHSKSPQIHTAFAQQTQQNIQYTKIHVDVGGFAQAIGNFQAHGGKGLNITVPFKQEAWQLAEQRSERADLAGAVNTLQFQHDGSIYGDNTDGIGLVNDVIHNLHWPIAGQRLLLLGAGGAARGIILPLLKQNPLSITIVNRTVSKADKLADIFAPYGNIHAASYAALKNQQFDILFNATSSSLQNTLPPLPDTIIGTSGYSYDLMYSDSDTPFMQWAYQHGAKQCSDGLGMLVEQAAESFFLWRAIRPDTQPIIQQLRKTSTGIN